MKINLTYIVSNIDKALAFEWVAAQLDKDKFDLKFILLNPNNSELEQFLKKNNVPVKRIKYRGKKDLIRAVFQCWYCLMKWNASVVHTHLFDANIVGLLSAKLANVKKRIHTRHHGSQNHMNLKSGIKYDRLVNFLSTDIIAISQNVKEILEEKENVSSNKIEIINHGFDLSIFKNITNSSIVSLRAKYKIKETKPVIGVISRYTEGKGLQYVIPAYKRILEKHPKSLLILVNASGDFKQNIKKLLNEIPKENYIEIPFVSELNVLYQLFDIYIHVPINSHFEGFGQTYVEALASGIPSIFTLSGVASEFIEHKKNALVVNYQDSDDIYDKMVELMENKRLQNRLINNGLNSSKDFALKPFIQKLANLYLD